jgi:hypothetical protein
MPAPNVSFIRPELSSLMPQYVLIRDCLEGETRIKDCGETYLPMPGALTYSTVDTEFNAQLKARYSRYKRRAVFFNATRRTLAGLIGQVFIRDPEIELPPIFDKIKENATGAGATLIQECKKAVGFNLAYSRGGVFVDYPETNGGASIAEVEAGDIRPTVTVYGPTEIINWRVIDRGAREVLSLVVLAESYGFGDDGFEVKNACQFRVLALDESGNYYQEVFKEADPSKWDGYNIPKDKEFNHREKITPIGADGQPLKEIPFFFFGGQNNDSSPDNPTMYDLASINIAHYRNSADYEESCHVVGQPTPVVTGLTQEWIDKVLGGVLKFGSLGGIPLPEGADAKLLQPESNDMIKEAMEAKERQMVALGAKLVEQKSVQRTKFETQVDNTSETSTLSSAAKNVESAFLWALKWCGRYLGLSESQINGFKFSLNTDFDLANMSAEDIRGVVENWTKSAITFLEMRAFLRKAGQATEDDTKAQATIAAEQAAMLSLVTEATTPAEPEPAPDNDE